MPFPKMILPCGVGGINRHPNSDSVPPWDLHTAENVSNDYMMWQKLPGAFKWSNSIISSSATMGTYLFPFTTTNPYYVVVATAEENGTYGTLKAYSFLQEKSISPISPNYTSGMNIMGRNFMFVEGKTTSVDGANIPTRHVFMYTGMNYPIAWDFYSATAKIIDGTCGTDIPADWDEDTSNFGKPSGGVHHNNRMFSWGNQNDPHRLYFTTIRDHGDYGGEGSGTISVYSGEGDGIIGAVSFLGRLFVFKRPRGIYYLDDSLSHIEDWNVQRFNGAIGLASPNAICVTDDNVIFMAHDGFIHHLRGIVEFGDVRASMILPDGIEPFMADTFELSKLQEVRAAYIGSQKTVHFTLPYYGSTTGLPNRILSLDFSNPKQPVFLYNERDKACDVARYFSTDGREYLLNTGIIPNGTDQYVWICGRHEAHSIAGGAYTGTFRTPYLFPQGDSDNRVNVYNLEAVFQPAKASLVTFNIYQDDVLTQSVNMSIAQTGTALGSFTLGTNTLATDHNVTNIRKLIYGDTRRLQIEGLNTQNDSNFKISKLFVGVLKGNERLVE